MRIGSKNFSANQNGVPKFSNFGTEYGQGNVCTSSDVSETDKNLCTRKKYRVTGSMYVNQPYCEAYTMYVFKTVHYKKEHSDKKKVE